MRVLSRVFRGKYLALLRQAQAAGELLWHGELAGLAEPAAFAAWLGAQYRQEWVVYAKPPFGGPAQVLKYLARYTHRVALSNRRLVSLADGEVVFTAKDYAAAGRGRLVRLAAAGELAWHGDLAGLAEPAAFAAWLREQYRPDWVVYAKPPFGGPEQVLKYLARYTHRVALSNRRLRAFDGQEVTFLAKDYAAGGRPRTVTLSAEEFLRRWVQHVLPRGFMKIRHYGLLANRGRAERLALCRTLLAVWAVARAVLGVLQPASAAGAESPRACPACGSERWLRVRELPRPTAGVTDSAAGAPDTS